VVALGNQPVGRVVRLSGLALKLLFLPFDHDSKRLFDVLVLRTGSFDQITPLPRVTAQPPGSPLVLRA